MRKGHVALVAVLAVASLSAAQAANFEVQKLADGVYAVIRKERPGAANRKSFLEGAPGFVTQLRGMLKDGKSLRGGALTDEERASGVSAAEIPDVDRAGAAADLVVYLPEDGILMSGDLVAWPVPLVGDPQSHIGHAQPDVRVDQRAGSRRRQARRIAG